MAPQVGIEPTTRRLTAGCSTAELLRSVTWKARVSSQGIPLLPGDDLRLGHCSIGWLGATTRLATKLGRRGDGRLGFGERQSVPTAINEDMVAL